MKVNMKEVMQKAHNLAKKFEGDYAARLSLALKIVWSLVKKGISYVIKSKKVNKWSKEGHNRLYIDGVLVSYFGKDMKSKEVKFSGYYDLNKKSAVRTGGHASFKEEIFAAIKEIGMNYKEENKVVSINTGSKFFPARFRGVDSETGEYFAAGDMIFYCEANGGYCKADNF